MSRTTSYEPIAGERHRHRGVEHAHPHRGPHTHEHAHGSRGHGHRHGLVDPSIQRSREGVRAVLRCSSPPPASPGTRRSTGS